MAAETKLNQLNRILNQTVKGLKQDKNTLGIFLKGSVATGKVWAESDIDLIRITKKGSRDVYWRWSEGIRIEITDIALKDWTKKKKVSNLERLEPHLFSLDKTKIIYDPQNIIKPKFKKIKYPANLKLHLMLMGLSDARYYTKGARKSIAFNKNLSCYNNLRLAVGSLATALFALNEVPREPRFWYDEFNVLKKCPDWFKKTYGVVVANNKLNNKDLEIETEKLWSNYGQIRDFCKKETGSTIKKLGGVNKAIKEAQLTDLYVDVLREMGFVK